MSVSVKSNITIESNLPRTVYLCAQDMTAFIKKWNQQNGCCRFAPFFGMQGWRSRCLALPWVRCKWKVASELSVSPTVLKVFSIGTWGKVAGQSNTCCEPEIFARTPSKQNVLFPQMVFFFAYQKQYWLISTQMGVQVLEMRCILSCSWQGARRYDARYHVCMSSWGFQSFL